MKEPTKEEVLKECKHESTNYYGNCLSCGKNTFLTPKPQAPEQGLEEDAENILMLFARYLGDIGWGELKEKLGNKIDNLLKAQRKEVKQDIKKEVLKWTSNELYFIQKQIKEENQEDIREYLIGQRNKLYDLQIFINKLTD